MTSSSSSAEIDPDLLPKLTTVLKWRAGPLEPEKTFYLIGTAHVSKKSCQDVEKVIRLVKPQVCCSLMGSGLAVSGCLAGLTLHTLLSPSHGLKACL